MTMKILLIFLSETDQHGEVPLYEAVIRKLSHMDLAGATVLRGIMGFGVHHKVHRDRLFGVADDRPIIIAISDTEERLRAAVPAIRSLVPQTPILMLDAESFQPFGNTPD
jgi:uncharacterized protein